MDWFGGREDGSEDGKERLKAEGTADAVHCGGRPGGMARDNEYKGLITLCQPQAAGLAETCMQAHSKFSICALPCMASAASDPDRRPSSEYRRHHSGRVRADAQHPAACFHDRRRPPEYTWNPLS